MVSTDTLGTTVTQRPIAKATADGLVALIAAPTPGSADACHPGQPVAGFAGIFAVRTGEDACYANVPCRAGVAFP
jgi:hypothetical protein